MKSDCILKSHKTAAECVRSPSELPLRCQHLITHYADCKKGMLDMRRRFRGNHLTDKEIRSSQSTATAVVDIDPGETGR